MWKVSKYLYHLHDLLNEIGKKYKDERFITISLIVLNMSFPESTQEDFDDGLSTLRELNHSHYHPIIGLVIDIVELTIILNN